MLDYNDLDLFDALETISLMDNYEFEKIRREFENNGYILKRNKNGDDTNVTVEKKQYLYKDSEQNLGLSFIFVCVGNILNNLNQKLIYFSKRGDISCDALNAIVMCTHIIKR